jgi:Fe-S cluster assembly iron-binding protein IscA
MNITFDSRTRADWLRRSVFSVKVWFVQKGCEGTKVEVLEQFAMDGLLEYKIAENLAVFIHPLDVNLLDGAVLTYVNGKWIFTSSQVVKRCGCGSSFAFSGLPHPGKQQKGEFLQIPGHTEEARIFQSAGLYFSEQIWWEYRMPSGNTTWYLLLRSSVLPSKILVNQADSRVQIRILILGSRTETVTGNIIWEITSNNSSLDIRVLTLVQSEESAKISVVWKVSEWTQNYEIQIHQSNVFLGSSGNISGIPGLQVASNDGVAEHSATFHTLQNTSLAYIMARWLSEKQAKMLLVNAQVTDIFPLLDTEYRTRMGY